MLKIFGGVFLFSYLVSAEPISEFEARPDDRLHPVVVTDQTNLIKTNGKLDPYAAKRLSALHHHIKDLTTVGGDSNKAMKKNHEDFQQSCQKMFDTYKATTAKEQLLIQQLDQEINHRDITRTNKSLDAKKRRFALLLDRITTEFKDNKEKTAKSAKHWKEYSQQIKKMRASLAGETGQKHSKAMGKLLKRMGSVTKYENGKESKQFAEQHSQFMKTEQLSSAYHLALLIEKTKANLATSLAERQLAALRIKRAHHQVQFQEAMGQQLEAHMTCSREKKNHLSQLENHKDLQASLDALVTALHSNK